MSRPRSRPELPRSSRSTTAKCRRLAGHSSLFRKCIDPLGQREIELGQSALAMGRKDESHFVIANVDVGMVFFFLSHFPDRAYEINGIAKIFELQRTFLLLLL